MTQQRVIRFITQCQANFADAARWRRPGGRIAVQLRQTFIVGETRNTKIYQATPLLPAQQS